MVRVVLMLFFVVAIAPAATIRLYLKDGGYHNVREYQKTGDRVRYWSTERGDWEEIPLELVDLKKTEAETARRDAERKEEAKAMDIEEKAERAQKREVEAIPYEAGVFLVKNEKATVLQNAEVKVVNNKRRSILKAMSPIPIVSGKATAEVDGLKGPITVPAGQQEFYIRQGGDERFEIAKLTPSKTSRIVQNWDIVPVSKELIEKTDVVETFRQQLGEGLYKIWPTKPLEPGEYAVVWWTEGKGDLRVWDFSVAK